MIVVGDLTRILTFYINPGLVISLVTLKVFFIRRLRLDFVATLQTGIYEHIRRLFGN